MDDLAIVYGFMAAAVLAAGFVSGFAGGLFGIGGGIVTVPVLYAVFHAFGVSEEASLKTAIGTSLAVIIVTSVRSLATHREAGQVDGAVLRAWAPWIALGAAAGGLLSRWIPAELLTIIFVGGAAWVGYRRLRGARAGGGPDLSRRRIHVPIGVGTGLFSSLMGLGGGAVGVMVMTWAGRSMHQAVATAAGFGVAVAAPGALGFVYSGLGAAALPPYSLGYVNGPAFLAMALMSAIAAPIGARLAHRVSGSLLSRLFGVYVLAASLALAVDVFAP